MSHARKTCVLAQVNGTVLWTKPPAEMVHRTVVVDSTLTMPPNSLVPVCNACQVPPPVVADTAVTGGRLKNQALVPNVVVLPAVSRISAATHLFDWLYRPVSVPLLSAGAVPADVQTGECVVLASVRPCSAAAIA